MKLGEDPWLLIAGLYHIETSHIETYYIEWFRYSSRDLRQERVKVYFTHKMIKKEDVNKI